MTYQDVRQVFAGKTVLVTGHTGFKGSWLTVWLQEIGCRVIGYALENTEGKANYHRSHIGQRIEEDYTADIRERETLWRVINRTQPDFVFHLAAQPLVRLSYAEPVETYEVNVMGTVNVLECIRQLEKNVTAIIVTTDKCYENKEWDWGYRETDRLGGHDPYSSSKACCELTVSSWRRSFLQGKQQPYRKLVSSVRAGNVIGGGDWALDRIVPDCIRAMESGQSVELRNPFAVRPWQHVLEPLWGYIKLAAFMEMGVVQPGAWNFGPDYDSCVSVREIAEEIIAQYGRGSCHVNVDSNAPKETNLLRLDNSKAKNQLHWAPVWNVKAALRMTVDWYKSYTACDTYDICVDQIHAYIEMMERHV